MTTFKLWQLLGAMMRDNEKTRRMPVHVDKSSFAHALESDGAVILKVAGLEVLTYHILDDDGGIKINKDGTESQRTSVVIYGDRYEPSDSDRKPDD